MSINKDFLKDKKCRGDFINKLTIKKLQTFC